MKRRLLKTLVAVLAIAAAATGPARAQNEQSETIATTAQVVEGTHFTISNNGGYVDYEGMVAKNGITVTSKNGEYITNVVITCTYDPEYVSDGNTSVSSGTKVITNNGETITVTGVNASTFTFTCTNGSPQFGQFVVYYYPPTTYTVRMAAGTEEAANWSIASGNASVPGTQVLENVMSGSQVTATYNGTTKKVKSVKAVKYVAPAATVTTAPTATETYIEVGTTTALVNAGVANGGTMMYAVTTTNVQPASTADFSATIPTAEGRTAGTYYVWFYAKADADHSDSEIAGPVSVTLAEATPALSLTSPAVGQVIGSDGKNYAAASVPSGVTKVAMIAYVSGSNGLAIALADEGSLNWETAKSTCEAKTPAFTGGTWHLPSQAEWNQMFSANGGDEERCYGLNAAINTAGGTALLEGGTGYWSSTPDGSKAWYVWLMDGETDWRSKFVNYVSQVRACLAF